MIGGVREEIERRENKDQKDKFILHWLRDRDVVRKVRN